MNKFVHESWLVVVLGVVFAGLLAGAQTSLAPRILANQTAELNAAVREVVPGTVRAEKVVVGGYDRDVYRCLDESGRLAGWAVDAAGMGFADKIRLVVGLAPDRATLTGLKVIENSETPGLGNKIAAEGPDAWPEQFRGLRADAPVVRVLQKASRERNEVQAVTGATISSDAVVAIVNEALGRLRPGLEQVP